MFGAQEGSGWSSGKEVEVTGEDWRRLERGHTGALNGGSFLGTSKSFWMVAGPDGHGDSDPVAKDSQERGGVACDGNRRDRA